MNIRKRLRYLLAGLMIVFAGLILAAFLLIGLDAPPITLSEDGLPATINFRNPRVMPEGVEWWEDGAVFLHGSFTQGTIFAVTDSGESSPFIENPDFVTTVGLHIDHARQRLLIAHGDIAVFRNQEASGASLSLYVYDLPTRELLFFTDLSNLYDSARHFSNDVTSDDAGNAYLTDSFSPVIYRVTPEGEAEAWLEYEGFGQDGLGLNGILYHPDGYLIVANMNESRWFKVPVDDPQAVSEIEFDEPVFTDGLLLHPSGAIISTNEGEVVAVVSEDEWASAAILARSSNADLEGITTLTLRDEDVYAIIGQLRNPLAFDYRIHRIIWDTRLS